MAGRQRAVTDTNTNGHKPALPKPRDYRHDCGRLLFRAILTPGALVEIRCPKCGRMAIFPLPVVANMEIENVTAVTSA